MYERMLPTEYHFVVSSQMYSNMSLIVDMDYIRKRLVSLGEGLQKLTKDKWSYEVSKLLSIAYMHEGSLDTSNMDDAERSYSLDLANKTKEALKRKFEEIANKRADAEIDKICVYLPGYRKAHIWDRLPGVGSKGFISKEGDVRTQGEAKKGGKVIKYKRKLDYMNKIGHLVNRFLEIWELDSQTVAEVLIEEILMGPDLSMSWSPSSVYAGMEDYDDALIVECFSGPFNNQRVIAGKRVDIILTPSKALSGVKGFSRKYPEGLDDVLAVIEEDRKVLFLMNPPFTEKLTEMVLMDVADMYTKHKDIVVFLAIPGFWDIYLKDEFKQIIKSLDADWSYVEKDKTQSSGGKDVYMKFLSGQVYGILPEPIKA